MHRIAISIKQPWATLVVFGIKRIEVRTWSTGRTGAIYIHAGRQCDRRDEGWKLVPAPYREFAELRGGLVGKAVLVGCRRYSSGAEFNRDLRLHWNPPEWFRLPVMYGFEFDAVAPIEFQPAKGGLYFFAV